MRTIALSLVCVLAAIGCGKQKPSAPEPAAPSAASLAPAGQTFTSAELAQFAALDPIDTHAHILQNSPVFFAMLRTLNLHVLDIVVVTTPGQKELDEKRARAWQFVRASDGHATLCTSFDPSLYAQPDFARAAIAEINHDFDQGAVAVKIWKTIGEQVRDRNGRYLMADDPVFQPIFKDIASRHKTLIAHLADPDSIWQAPDPASPDYSYYHTESPEWYMYKRPNAPSKEAILLARDHVLAQNPLLRVVGAHLGSMESNLPQLGQRLDQHPNFAVDLAARMPYLVMQPREAIIRFIEKYQDRLIYATDNGFAPQENAQTSVPAWESRYTFDWRFLATSDSLELKGHKVQGLALPLPVLHKLYHDNAVAWFPGILTKSQ